MNEIKLGNAYELIKKIPDKSIDLIVTDPPYDFMTNHKSQNYSGAGAFGKLGRTYHSELEDNNLIKGINKNMLKEFLRVMKKVNIYIWCNKAQIREYLDFFKDYNFEILCWHKTNPIPTCSNKYLSDTEYCLFFRESGVKIYGTYETKSKYYLTQINKEDKKKYNHPTIKPIEIIKNLIINSSVYGDVVFDPFVGSGTTCVAAKELGRKYLGFEINENYYNIAVDRLNGVDQNGEIDLFSVDYEQLDLFK